MLRPISFIWAWFLEPISFYLSTNPRDFYLETSYPTLPSFLASASFLWLITHHTLRQAEVYFSHEFGPPRSFLDVVYDCR